MLRLKQFVANESGATMIEYALIASLVAVALIGSLNTLKNSVSGTFTKIGNNL